MMLSIKLRATLIASGDPVRVQSLKKKVNQNAVTVQKIIILAKVVKINLCGIPWLSWDIWILQPLSA